MMIKTLVPVLLFFGSLSCLAQTKDTIHLQEIKIDHTSKKINYLKARGGTTSLTGNQIKSLMSRVDDIPGGKLTSIRLYFNSKVLFFVNDFDKDNYKDVELGLVVYEAAADGSLGPLITDKEIRFVVSADHRGMLELDLGPLYLSTSPSMYFGIELLHPQQGTDIKIMLVSDKKHPNQIYMKHWKSVNWEPFGFPNDNSLGIKMDLGIR